jgi:hypothetical protein
MGLGTETEIPAGAVGPPGADGIQGNAGPAGASTNTVVDNGQYNSTYGSISPIDGGTP